MADFGNYIAKGKKGHLIGVGGVSMSPLAEVLSGFGLKLTGSDMAESEKTEHLRSLGIDVIIGHAAENLAPDVDFVVRTAAVHDDNPEIMAARELGIPVFERTQAWGAIMRDYKNALCISGTHGKTTTTSMCTHILMAARRDPTIMLGGTLPLLKANHRVGAGDTIVMESCEYYNSFHAFFPTIAVILNIEADHLDFFKDLDDVKNSFRCFADLVPEDGCIIANVDDENTMDALTPLNRPLLTFGLGQCAVVRGENLVSRGGKTDFDVIYDGKLFTHVVLNVPGRHNVMNALAACASAICLGVPGEAVAEGLAAFSGAGRRFEFKGSCRGADVYDDYAHHPGELKALFDAVEALDYSRVIVAFQPHTYTRTRALFDNFVEQLRRPTLTYLAEIYAAREKSIAGVSSQELAKKVPNSRFFPTLDSLEAALLELAAPGDIILTVGAGDIFKVGEALVRAN
ncbi:MAG: UDP-N-acetylmuramate--L-alanine ligase [Oscillospiraceae bacterium]|jgi:UDP-N-acetylmuramate--alanine ligase|nr:UDP-N-acetylmuramate--L-alanine ligase [Oscillospiraceae bacterium]